MGLELIKKMEVRNRNATKFPAGFYINKGYIGIINLAARIKYNISKGDSVYLYFDKREMILGIQKAEKEIPDTFKVQKNGMIHLKSVFREFSLSIDTLKGKYDLIREEPTDSILRVDLNNKWK